MGLGLPNIVFRWMGRREEYREGDGVERIHILDS
jgi:hypothetical protein